VTEHVDNPGEFVRFAEQYSGKALVYAGLNPRPFRFQGKRKRAKDEDIEIMARILFDVELDHKKGTDLAWENVVVLKPLVNCVADYFQERGWKRPIRVFSGNGYHLIPVLNPFPVGDGTKQQVRKFFEEIREVIQRKAKELLPKQVCRVDSTYDLSRISKVAGTLSRKGTDKSLWRLAVADPRLDRYGSPEPDEKLSQYIQRIKIDESETKGERHNTSLPENLANVINSDRELKRLWQENPRKGNGGQDRSLGDFIFVRKCLEMGVTSDDNLQVLLIKRPVGKGRERQRGDYIQRTIQRAKQKR
jgi:hypothetical protein